MCVIALVVCTGFVLATGTTVAWSNPCGQQCQADTSSISCAACCRSVLHRVPWNCPLGLEPTGVDTGCILLVQGDVEPQPVGQEKPASCCDGLWDSSCWDIPSQHNFFHSCNMCTALPHCFNGVVDGGESDVDCGGATTCTRCAQLQLCITDRGNSDCSPLAVPAWSSVRCDSAAFVTSDSQRVTESSGSAQSTSNYQPGLVLQFLIQPSNFGHGGVYAGFVRTMAIQNIWASAPSCEGDVLAAAQNGDIFAVIGLRYNSEVSSDSFSLPDLRGRAIVGASPSYSLGSFGGTASVTLTAQNLPIHTHTVGSTGVGPVGSGAPFSNEAPFLTMTYLICTSTMDELSFPGIIMASAGVAPLASVSGGGGVSIPLWLPCDGASYQTSLYHELFAVLGYTFGGNGGSTFAVPDLRGRVVIGAGNSAFLGVTFPVGATIGQAQTTLQSNQMPAHRHSLSSVYPATTSTTAQSQAVSNWQPSVALNVIICTQGTAPNTNSPIASPTHPYVGEVAFYAGVIPPTNWQFAQGQLLALAQNTALFAFLGTTYGGDGRTTFALPDLIGRVILGQSATDASFALAQPIGDLFVRFSPPQLPPHRHPIPNNLGVCDYVPLSSSSAPVFSSSSQEVAPSFPISSSSSSSISAPSSSSASGTQGSSSALTIEHVASSSSAAASTACTNNGGCDVRSECRPVVTNGVAGRVCGPCPPGYYKTATTASGTFSCIAFGQLCSDQLPCVDSRTFCDANTSRCAVNRCRLQPLCPGRQCVPTGQLTSECQ